jgi:hypothetical protein
MQPPISDLPGLVDTRVSGIRLMNTAVKAKPPLPTVDTGRSGRAEEAMLKARNLAIAAEERKRYEARSRAIARLKDKGMESQIIQKNKQGEKNRRRSQMVNQRNKNATAEKTARLLGVSPDLI